MLYFILTLKEFLQTAVVKASMQQPHFRFHNLLLTNSEKYVDCKVPMNFIFNNEE